MKRIHSLEILSTTIIAKNRADKIDQSRSGVLIDRVIESVVEPHTISFHSIPIIVPVPSVVGMCSVLDVEDGVAEAGFSVRRVHGLRLGHAVPRDIIDALALGMITSSEYSKLLGFQPEERVIYLVASPSMFPPSPMVI